MEAIKERFEKILDRIETSGKSATEWFGKYTHDDSFSKFTGAKVVNNLLFTSTPTLFLLHFSLK